jgi:hypothetical protein
MIRGIGLICLFHLDSDKVSQIVIKETATADNCAEGQYQSYNALLGRCGASYSLPVWNQPDMG